MPTVDHLGLLLSDEPWTLPDSAGGLSAKGGRPCLWTSPDVTTVRVRGAKSTLPPLGLARTGAGETWARWELPAATVPGDSAAVAQDLRLLVVRRDGAAQEVTVTLEGALPTPDAAAVQTPADEPASADDAWLSAAREAQAICGIHVETVNECYDDRPAADEGWSGIAEGLAVRGWPRLLEFWRENQDPREPRLALIVKIALGFAAKLESICRRPRRVLRRVRDFERPERVRQTDPSCIRWLVRQPGRTHLERCGPKGRLLAVVRFENADTPENRVAKDFLLRARRACSDYILQNRKNSGKQRVMDVRRFLMLVNRLLWESEVGRVGQLAGMPDANYVLLYDPRYRELWSWYQRLRRQQDEQDSVWQWRHRVWAETCLLALGDCVEEARGASGSPPEGGVAAPPAGPAPCAEARHLGAKSLVYLRLEQDCGQFLDRRSPIGPWVLARPGGPVFVHVIRREQLHLLANRHDRMTLLAAMAPDFVFAAHRPGQRMFDGNLLAVWCAMSFGLNSAANLQARVDSIRERLVGCTAGGETDGRGIDGMILEPRAGGGKTSPDFAERGDAATSWCVGLGLPPPIQEHRGWLRYVMDALLCLE